MGDILAKPSGILLNDHINNVLVQANIILNCFPFYESKYKELTDKDLRKRLSGSVKFHDDGKKLDRWQNACKRDYENFVNGKLNKNDFGNHLRNAKIRHEIGSLVLNQKNNFSCPVKVAIAAHHGKLSHYHSNKWNHNDWRIENSNELWNNFVNLNNSIRLNDFNKACLLNYEFAAVRTLLQLSDNRASQLEDKKKLPNFNKFEYNFPFSEKRSIQKIIEENWNQDLLIIRAPTGSGKTDAALLWADLQIKNKKSDRLVFTLPTRFTSNALSLNINDSVSTGLYHSTAFYSKYINSIFDSEYLKTLHKFERNLLFPATVCTIDHLLISLTLSREDHHSILFNLANSCVVIDEADFYDEFTLSNIMVLLEYLKILKVPILIMSASIPNISKKLYQKIGFENIEIKEDLSKKDEIKCDIKDIIEVDFCDKRNLREILKERISKPLILYANTIQGALNYYNFIKEEFTEKPILYHSRFTEPDKAKKEKLLIEKLGSKAWQSRNANGIAILTQIGEMSVNISADVMISEICPIDRLIQRIGRLSRFENSIRNDLFVIIPTKNLEFYPAPYGNYNNGWITNKFLIKTKELLEKKKYTNHELTNLLNKVYNEDIQFSVESLSNSKLLKEYFVSNWLILPQALLSESDENTILWKSRNIGNQITVFIKYPENDFKNFSEYNIFKLKYGIDCYSYQVINALKNGIIYKVNKKIDDENYTLLVVKDEYYSYETGLRVEVKDSDINTLI